MNKGKSTEFTIGVQQLIGHSATVGMLGTLPRSQRDFAMRFSGMAEDQSTSRRGLLSRHGSQVRRMLDTEGSRPNLAEETQAFLAAIVENSDDSIVACTPDTTTSNLEGSQAFSASSAPSTNCIFQRFLSTCGMRRMPSSTLLSSSTSRICFTTLPPSARYCHRQLGSLAKATLQCHHARPEPLQRDSAGSGAVELSAVFAPCYRVSS